MATKQASMRNKKQQKAKARQKDLRSKANPNTNKPTEAQLAYSIKRDGLIATAKKYRKVLDKGDLSQGPDNNTISQGFITFIDIMAPIHSTVEMLSILVKEGKVTLTPEDQIKIDKFDKQVVNACEDITAIGILMEEGLTFPDFSHLYVHYAELSAEMASSTARDVYNGVVKQHGVLISEYAREHKVTGEVDMAFAMRMHERRMKTIYPLYRTIVEDTPLDPEVGEDDGIPAEFIPADAVCEAELVNDVDVDTLRDVSKEDK